MIRQDFLTAWNSLTQAEKETVYLLVELDSDREIASYRNVSLACVAKTKSSIYRKFGLINEFPHVKREIIKKAYRKNLQLLGVQWHTQSQH